MYTQLPALYFEQCDGIGNTWHVVMKTCQKQHLLARLQLSSDHKGNQNLL